MTTATVLQESRNFSLEMDLRLRSHPAAARRWGKGNEIPAPHLARVSDGYVGLLSRQHKSAWFEVIPPGQYFGRLLAPVGVSILYFAFSDLSFQEWASSSLNLENVGVKTIDLLYHEVRRRSGNYLDRANRSHLPLKLRYPQELLILVETIGTEVQPGFFQLPKWTTQEMLSRWMQTTRECVVKENSDLWKLGIVKKISHRVFQINYDELRRRVAEQEAECRK